jgi:hypothetical protein
MEKIGKKKRKKVGGLADIHYTGITARLRAARGLVFKNILLMFLPDYYSVIAVATIMERGCIVSIWLERAKPLLPFHQKEIIH